MLQRTFIGHIDTSCDEFDFRLACPRFEPKTSLLLAGEDSTNWAIKPSRLADVKHKIQEMYSKIYEEFLPTMKIAVKGLII
jgi:hypothetical protein